MTKRIYDRRQRKVTRPPAGNPILYLNATALRQVGHGACQLISSNVNNDC